MQPLPQVAAVALDQSFDHYISLSLYIYLSI